MRNRNKEKKCVLLVYFRDPFKHLGGADSVIRSHCELLKKRDVEVYILFPVFKEIGLKRKNVPLHAWGLLHERNLISVTNAYRMRNQIRRLVNDNECMGVFIHSLIWSDLRELHAIISFRKEIILYLHDYSTCCAQYTLMKNDKAYCGNARLYDEKCGSCKYYADGLQLKRNTTGFLSKIIDLKVVSPSSCLAENWSEAFPEYRDRIQVIGHKKCIGNYFENRDVIRNDDKIRVAFVGKAIKEKGFNFWIEAVDKICSKTDRFEFLFFGHNQIDNPNVKCVNVSIVNDGLDAMTKALRKHRVHVAFLFSIIPETYSLTYYECMSSNCYIVTSNLSGNIEREVVKNKNGIVLDCSSAAIENFFSEQDKLVEMLNNFRSDGLVGPDRLVDNDDFMNLLKTEKVGKFDDIRIPVKDCFKAFFAKILYRVRYRQF